MSSAEIEYFSRRDRQKSSRTDFDSEKGRLNYYLHKIALHDTGTCDSCRQAETMEHYLINCSQNEIATAVKDICDQRKISFTLPTILRQVAVLEELRHLTHRQL